jgi:hypothetical protein
VEETCHLVAQGAAIDVVLLFLLGTRRALPLELTMVSQLRARLGHTIPIVTVSSGRNSTAFEQAGASLCWSSKLKAPTLVRRLSKLVGIDDVLRQPVQKVLRRAALGEDDVTIGQALNLTAKTMRVYYSEARSFYGVKTNPEVVACWQREAPSAEERP